MQISTSSWSSSDWELLYYVIYTGLALLFWVILFVGYRPRGPKYNDLYWAILLIIGGSLLFAVYTQTIEHFG
jgi:hypothetical protein